MPKITDKNELTTPASGDKLVIVDVSDTTEAASGSTKRITYDNLGKTLADSADIDFTESTDITAALTNTGVTADTYANATVTVDAKGRVTAASAGSGFDNEVPLAIDLDTPGTPGSVVATFTADNAATAAIIEAYKGTQKHLELDEYGRLELVGDKNYTQVGTSVHRIGKSGEYFFINTGTVSNGTTFLRVYADIRGQASDITARSINGMAVTAVQGDNSSFIYSTGSTITGLTTNAEHDKSSGTLGNTVGARAASGASRAGGTVTQATGVETQITSTGTVTTAIGVNVKAPTTGGNVTTSKGIVIEAHDIDIDSAGGVIIFANLPTSDPANVGQLWNDSGTLKVSAG